MAPRARSRAVVAVLVAAVCFQCPAIRRSESIAFLLRLTRPALEERRGTPLRSRVARHFFGEVKFEAPDFSGDKRKKAALKLSQAKQALDQARELMESGQSAPAPGQWYRVITEGEFGIGIRKTPELDGPRTGDDLLRGTVFEVDEVLETEGAPTFLRLKDGSGWVFDTSPVDPENPSVEKLEDVLLEGISISALEEEVEEARRELDAIRGGKRA
eukprot:TRINITY_DN90897_c0_g1_i1.p1 TRINITY_DN90897_c0_g1~~TRINITY_DN90897_c0_g1_i1.p1  ORF type:complete len:215 (+),score=46.13 TRINITY_DN90897_c0_g1_i1:35-679(+)